MWNCQKQEAAAFPTGIVPMKRMRGLNGQVSAIMMDLIRKKKKARVRRHVKQFKRDSINSCGWNCLGLVRTSGHHLMAHGISSLVLTNLRLLIAGGILIVLAYATAMIEC